MRRIGAIVVAALLSSSAAVPALAAWDPVGSVSFSNRETHDAKLGNFKGTAVGLTARDSTVMCDSVIATFGNGRTREIFRGELPRGQTIRIGLPGNERSIDRVDFDCRSMDGRSAMVAIAVDDGRGFDRREAPDYYSRQQYPDTSRQQNPDYDSRQQNPDEYVRPQTPDYYDRRANPDYYGPQNPDPYGR